MERRERGTGWTGGREEEGKALLDCTVYNNRSPSVPVPEAEKASSEDEGAHRFRIFQSLVLGFIDGDLHPHIGGEDKYPPTHTPFHKGADSLYNSRE